MFTVTIKTDNAAFQDGDGFSEVARILRKLADEVEAGALDGFNNTGRVYDANGNACGQYTSRIPTRATQR